jgi:hypothetical protein
MKANPTKKEIIPIPPTKRKKLKIHCSVLFTVIVVDGTYLEIQEKTILENNITLLRIKIKACEKNILLKFLIVLLRVWDKKPAVVIENPPSVNDDTKRKL